LIHGILSTRYRGRRNPKGFNILYDTVRTILQTRPADDFCVLEAALGDLTPIDFSLSLIRPKIGVVTHVGMDHISMFGSIEAIAAEKSKLVLALPRDGIAVLNADDPRVLAMQNLFAGRVITYGLSHTAMLRAEKIGGDWPDRLSFTALYENQSARVQTQLCGTHWAASVLAAMAVGLAMGIPLDAAAEAIRNVEPVDGRMSPVTMPDGVTFIRDDCKSPLWTIPASLEFLNRAQAKRKIIVMGTISDYHGNPAQKYPRVARQALEVADLVIFVSQQATMALRARHPADGSSLRAFTTADQALPFLRGYLQSGDLVLLKGSEKAENLGLIVTAWGREATDHAHQSACSSESSAIDERSSISRDDPITAAAFRGQVVVGLGNPGQAFQQTPHNVGQQALDVLAEPFKAEWSQHDDALVAWIRWDEQPLLLIKPQRPVNETGPLLLRLASRFAFGPQNCILVHDDIHLPTGRVRKRMNGSAGGHKGVESILIAFQSEGFRRVKIGVGQPVSRDRLLEYVLTPFDADKREVIRTACQGAADCIVQMINPQRHFDPTAGIQVRRARA
jgi:aminoacyl-tRNA hydrolase